MAADSGISARYLEPEFIASFRKAFESSATFHDAKSNSEIKNNPYLVATLPNFLASASLVDALSTEISRLGMKHKHNDLHDFFQSLDLKKSKLSSASQAAVPGLLTIMTSSLWRTTLSQMTGIPLWDAMDISAQIYKQGGRLLCHDDACEGRRIAYILYLVDNDWTSSDGGTLDLFKTAPDGHPLDIELSIVPRRNTLLFFEVTPISYHQVSEVLARSKVRRSIAGWFHGPSPKYAMADFLSRLYPGLDTALTAVTPASSRSSSLAEPELETLSDWTHPLYLSLKLKTAVSAVLRDERVAELKSFLLPLQQSQVKAIVETSLQKASSLGEWIWLGPANFRHFREWHSHSDLPLCFSLFSSRAMRDYVAELSGLPLGPAVQNALYLLAPGDYHLVHDEFSKPRASVDLFYFYLINDAAAFLNDASVSTQSLDSWNPDFGGTIRYNLASSEGDEEQVIAIEPCSNSLFIVLRSIESQQTIDYIKKSSTQGGYICMTASFDILL